MLHPQQRQAYTAFLIWNGGFAFAFTLITTVNLVYQFQVAHLTPLQLVLVGTVLEIVCFLAQIPTGVLADVYSRRWAIIGGTFLVGLGFTIEGVFPHFAAILLAQVCWGLGVTLTNGADGAWLASEVGEEHLAVVYLRAGQLGQALSLLAILLSVALASIRLNLPVVLGGVLFMALAISLPTFLHEHAFTPPPRAERTNWQMFVQTMRQGTRTVRVSPMLRVFMLIELCYGLASEGFDRLWQPFFLTSFALPHSSWLQPVAWIGISQFGAALLGVGAAQFMRTRIDRDPRWQSVTALLIINGMRIASFVLFALAGNAAVALMMLWMVSVLGQLNHPLYDARFIRSTAPAVRATVLSLRGQVNAFGQIAGGPGVGVIGNRSLRAAMLVVGVMLSPVLPLLVTVRHVETRASMTESNEGGRSAADKGA